MFQLSTKLASMKSDVWTTHENRPKYQLSSFCFNREKWRFLERDAVPTMGPRNQPYGDLMWWYKSLRGTDPSASLKEASSRHNGMIELWAPSWGQTHTCLHNATSTWAVYSRLDSMTILRSNTLRDLNRTDSDHSGMQPQAVQFGLMPGQDHNWLEVSRAIS